MLYAIWSVNEYKINYSIGTGATQNPNPTSYNVWTDDITLADPTDIKEGYQFLGWFDDLGNKVTTIVKSSIGDRSYTAKWAHAGIFTLSSKVTTASDTTGVKVIYTIERTLPEGTEAIATEAPTTEAPAEEKKGCGGFSTYAILTVLVCGACLSIKRKEK